MEENELPIMKLPLRAMERGVDDFIMRVFDAVHDLSGNGFFVTQICFEDSKHCEIHYRRREPII